MPSRRAVLVAMVAVSSSGCIGGRDFTVTTDPATATRTPSPRSDSDPSPRSGSDCAGATVDPEGVDPEGYQPEGETVTLYRDYLRVQVEATADDVPDLRGRIEKCDGTKEVRRSIPGAGRHAFEFGPFGHHCVGEYEFWLDGCR